MINISLSKRPVLSNYDGQRKTKQILVYNYPPIRVVCLEINAQKIYEP